MANTLGGEGQVDGGPGHESLISGKPEELAAFHKAQITERLGVFTTNVSDVMLATQTSSELDAGIRGLHEQLDKLRKTANKAGELQESRSQQAYNSAVAVLRAVEEVQIEGGVLSQNHVEAWLMATFFQDSGRDKPGLEQLRHSMMDRNSRVILPLRLGYKGPLLCVVSKKPILLDVTTGSSEPEYKIVATAPNSRSLRIVLSTINGPVEVPIDVQDDQFIFGKKGIKDWGEEYIIDLASNINTHTEKWLSEHPGKEKPSQLIRNDLATIQAIKPFLAQPLLETANVFESRLLDIIAFNIVDSAGEDIMSEWFKLMRLSGERTDAFMKAA
jgi:hypothetical protein